MNQLLQPPAPSLMFTRDGNSALLKAEQALRKPLAEAFPFFADAQNLETLTPAFLNFRITTPLPIQMREGLHIDYRLSLHGLPMRWRSLISAWEPPYRFIDEQVKGPYTRWHHEHLFEERRLPDGQPVTVVTDRVHFRTPLGMLTEWFVRRDLRTIFNFRQRTLESLFNS